MKASGELQKTLIQVIDGAENFMSQSKKSSSEDLRTHSSLRMLPEFDMGDPVRMVLINLSVGCCGILIHS